MSRLSELLKDLKTERELTNPQIVESAKRQGLKLSAGNVSNYLNGNHPERPPTKTLAAFAKVFGVPVSDLEAAAAYTGREPFTPDPSSDRLTAPQRAAVNEIIRLLADGNTGAGESNGSPMNDAGGKPATEEAQLASDFVESKRRQREGGAGGNVHHLVPPPPAEKTAAYRTRSRDKEEEERSRQRGEETQERDDDD
ncbi:helix-turn-helix domain-containing protein [Brevibacterium casei]|uniref:Cro/C1-type HTH DNA-binding domain-containing protein n=1 Tax=Brevibacterium casei CIP 102111 TaxID=1255625 RepID=A0A2H1IY07_9MICO|nr:helix-turn-helix domain-containing protein [Brevibacterium casei]QPR39540.1 helix-turn-helix domain-containing protein [Brevibacterium casei]QPR43705.1 helix-turn-helix domain-containing protein [Brevibacterium casei]SMX80083.1 Cro/C1-type HTH DNA-binding domain-containing protein [Brevibacterium casei CIP 102111]